MRKFLKNTRGAVTVFVTLLLIPAILLSGTAVDLARIHTARSILQDANQLAANAVLTQYNALLYDLYGIFGVASNDPVIGELLDDYIRVSVFGEELPGEKLGTLQLFYGSDLSMDRVRFARAKNLSDEDVLRRQIEEYMKFRAPVIIIKEFIDKLGGNKIKEDTAVIEDKLAIDKDIADLYEKYKELYEAINAADLIIQMDGGISGGSFGSVSSGLRNIRDYFTQLVRLYSDWESEEDENARSGIEKRYQEVLNSIARLTTGGPRGSPQGLNKTISNAREQAENFKPKFDLIISLAIEIDEKHDELNRKIDELERKLEEKECSNELKEALEEKQGTPPMTLIERYRELLKWDNIEGMAEVNKDAGYRYIDNEVKPLLDGVMYRNKYNASAGSLTRAELAEIASNPSFGLAGGGSSISRFAGFAGDSITYNMPPGFLKFAEHSGEHKEFYETLKAMMNQPQLDAVKMFDGQGDEGGGSAKEKQENLIDAVLKLVDSAYIGLTNSPLGAMQINDAETPDPEKLGILDIVKLIPEAIGSNVMKAVHDPLGTLADAGDYFLLLTYCTSMFSNYTTTRPESIGKTKESLNEINFTESVTGVPISPEVNYFFQSEWEYLYEGSSNAGKNLNAITKLIFIVRLVCNYISVFSVSEVTMVVSGIQTAFAWCPPLGIILGELARAAFVAAETLIDVAVLRSGHKLPLIKKAANQEWVCSPSGVVKAISNIVSGESNDSKGTDDENGFSYSNYTLVFFIAKAVFYTGPDRDASTELANRTANLIEWNMINYQNGICADEEKMTEALAAEDRFRLADMGTDFSIITTANMRMLFLSMIFAQNFSDARGIGMPATMPIVAIDYRGY